MALLSYASDQVELVIKPWILGNRYVYEQTDGKISLWFYSYSREIVFWSVDDLFCLWCLTPLSTIFYDFMLYRVHLVISGDRHLLYRKLEIHDHDGSRQFIQMICYIRRDLPFSYKAIRVFVPHFSLSIPGHSEHSESLLSNLSLKLP